jgi:hypothetical protein
MGFPNLKAPHFVGLLAPARTPSAIVEQIARATRTALAERAYQQFLIDGCFEPDVDSNSDKFRRSKKTLRGGPRSSKRSD